MPRLRAYVRRLVGDRETEDEIVQETSLRALAGEGPSDRDHFTAWSCGIARHVVGLEWRRRRRARLDVSIGDTLNDESGGPIDRPESRLDARESLLQVMNDPDLGALELLIRRDVLGKPR